MPPQLLILEDDPLVEAILKQALNTSRAIRFSKAQDVLVQMAHLQPHAVFVDVHLEGELSGLDILPQLRTHWPNVPILVMTADPHEEVLATAFARGADDFLKKPLLPVEVQARLAARLGARLKGNSLLQFEDLTLHTESAELHGNGTWTALSPLESRVLAFLVETQGNLVDRATLQGRIWGQTSVGPSSLDRVLSALRRKLQEVKSRVAIHSEYGKGIQLRGEERGL